jgi:hypothetical protein
MTETTRRRSYLHVARLLELALLEPGRFAGVELPDVELIELRRIHDAMRSAGGLLADAGTTLDGRLTLVDQG